MAKCVLWESCTLLTNWWNQLQVWNVFKNVEYIAHTHFDSNELRLNATDRTICCHTGASACSHVHLSADVRFTRAHKTIMRSLPRNQPKRTVCANTKLSKVIWRSGNWQKEIGLILVSFPADRKRALNQVGFSSAVNNRGKKKKTSLTNTLGCFMCLSESRVTKSVTRRMWGGGGGSK